MKGIISCNTKGVIFTLTCPCEKAYIGKTSHLFETKNWRTQKHHKMWQQELSSCPMPSAEFNHPISSLKYKNVWKAEVEWALARLFLEHITGVLLTFLKINYTSLK